MRDLTKVVSNATEFQYKQLIRVIKFVEQTRDDGIKIKPNEDNKWKLTAYADSDWAGDMGDRKSISGWILFMNGAPILWGSKKQGSVAISSTEAEYVALSEMSKEVLFMHSVLSFIQGKPVQLPINVYCDNTGAIYITKNPQLRRVKHIDNRYHYVKDYVEDGLLKIQYIGSEANLADPFTKNLPKKNYDTAHPYMERV